MECKDPPRPLRWGRLNRGAQLFLFGLDRIHVDVGWRAVGFFIR
jgi:hypothetical protein